MTDPTPPERSDLDPAFLARRRRRSIALALVLGALAIIFYVLTIAKLGPNVFNREL